MSAQVADFAPVQSSISVELEHQEVRVAESNPSPINKIHFEVLYQLFFAPPPTREQLAMEEFLLECD